MKWIVICDGGPNNTTVGTEQDSLGKACGSLEFMMRNLNATVGQVYQEPVGQQKIDQERFVEAEKDAGREKK